jgi:hypothetical protein
LSYLFHSNYPYFQALHLGRFVRSLARIEDRLASGSTPTQRLCHVACHAGNVVFKDKLFDPGVSPEEFARRQAEESRFRALSDEARERELNDVVARLREEDLVDDPEDAWRKPVTDRDRVVEFVSASRTALRPLAEFVVTGDSLVEDLVVWYVHGPGTRRHLRGIYGLLAAWDLMRMQHEGKPPYTISFAPAFAESLEEALRTEGDPEPNGNDLLARLSRPHAYRMKPRDFTVARAGVNRARRALVLPEAVARELLEQLHSWAAG